MGYVWYCLCSDILDNVSSFMFNTECAGIFGIMRSAVFLQALKQRQ